MSPAANEAKKPAAHAEALAGKPKPAALKGHNRVVKVPTAVSDGGMIAVIRIRGTPNIEPRIKLGLGSLRLHRPNNMALLPNDNQSRQMVQRVKDYVTFGEIDGKTLTQVFERRLETLAGRRADEAFLKERKISGFAQLSAQALEGKIRLNALGISNVCRLHPPRKGHKRKGIKAPYSSGGALGNRGQEINELIMRMV